MKKNRTVVTIIFVFMTIGLLGATLYISTLLSSSNSPTKIQKTKAAAVTYTRKVDLFPTGVTQEPTSSFSPSGSISPTTTPSKTPTLLAQVPTVIPTIIPTKIPIASSPTPPAIPTNIQEPTALPATPTLQPLLAYKSTTISPTVIPITNSGGATNPTIISSPTKKMQPTGVQQLPETGWIQTSSILFIVAASTILFSLLF